MIYNILITIIVFILVSVTYLILLHTFNSDFNQAYPNLAKRVLIIVITLFLISFVGIVVYYSFVMVRLIDMRSLSIVAVMIAFASTLVKNSSRSYLRSVTLIIYVSLYLVISTSFENIPEPEYQFKVFLENLILTISLSYSAWQCIKSLFLRWSE